MVAKETEVIQAVVARIGVLLRPDLLLTAILPEEVALVGEHKQFVMFTAIAAAAVRKDELIAAVTIDVQELRKVEILPTESEGADLFVGQRFFVEDVAPQLHASPVQEDQG